MTVITLASAKGGRCRHPPYPCNRALVRFPPTDQRHARRAPAGNGSDEELEWFALHFARREGAPDHAAGGSVESVDIRRQRFAFE